ncbi:MAG: hypothetical protein KGL11_09420 [Alphaproteobacteria bacterium]|nr:hypothetical protein [Alphaproteobacteria bacterium]
MRTLTQLRKWWAKRFGKQAREEAEAKRIALGAQRLIDAYGALMEKYPAGYVDASVLPADKDTLKLAIKIMWKLSDDNFRSLLGGGFVGLYRFQDGVGPKPITGSPENVGVSELKKSPELMKAVIAATDQFLNWSTRTKSEMDGLLAEFRAFEKAQKVKLK